MAALTRGQFEPLRTGAFVSVHIAWNEAWTMAEGVQPLFPVPSCAVFGRKRAIARALPKTVRAYSGSLPLRDAPEAIADGHLTVIEGAPALETAKHRGGSTYRTAFRNGATLFPRMLIFVERKVMGRIGVDPSAPLVTSRRNNQEKEPWKSLPSIENRVEAEFLRPVLLGESILPFRVFRPFEAVVPITKLGHMLDAEAAANLGFDGLHGWMRKAEAAWDANKRSDKMKLAQLFDYFGQLSAQFPVAPVRVVYAKAGSLPAACAIHDQHLLVENLLYWAAVTTDFEAAYLSSILNSETVRFRIESMQARGQFGARHFDKVMFNLPIPRFDAVNQLHLSLSEAAGRAEAAAALVALPEGVKFQRARGLIRAALAEAGIAQEIDGLVARLLDGG